MGQNQPTPEQIAALQQTNQFGGMGDPAMQGPGGQLPAMPLQPPAVTAQVVATGILTLMQSSIGREKELQFDILTTGLNTLATAYKSLTEQQATGPDPEIERAKAAQEMQIEMTKAQHDMQIKQAELEMKQKMADAELDLKRAGFVAEQDSRDKDRAFNQQLQTRQQQHKEATDAQTLSSQHEIGMTKAKQRPKAGTSDSSGK
jgi:uncharacterized membrane protein YkoI